MLSEELTIDDEFDRLSAAIRDPEVDAGDIAYRFATHARLASALRDIREGKGTGRSDVGVLVAAALKRSTEATGRARLRVPEGDPNWPSRDEWSRYGLIAIPAASGFLELEVDASPGEWVGFPDAEETLKQLFNPPKHLRRTEWRVIADPTFSARLGPGFDHYVSLGQRQAVRSILGAKPGATLVVSLPTGGGKTEVALAEALSTFDAGTTLFIVPTISLALDQERRFRQLLEQKGDDERASWTYAYVSDVADEARAGVRRRIRTGEQCIVFTSPESACGSLAPALFDAAAGGQLRLLVIDEAHLVAAWGGGFRPHFQQLAGLRTALIRTASEASHRPFKTLLLSATLPQATLELLERLFREPGPFESVIATALRPEPSYWVSKCSTEAEREARLVAALVRLPRPVILYVAEREDARRYSAVLAAAGYQAHRVFTGDTRSAERREALQGLRGPWSCVGSRADIIVATTAFGVGVDQPNVRAVIHLCVPESLDRFYQEVGRGGRDGAASVSLLLWTDEDLPRARRLAQERLITPEKGLPRLHALRVAARDIGEGRRQLPLDSRPSHIDDSNRANRAWNLRTLALIAQAELIRLDFERPSSIRETQVDDDDPAEDGASPETVAVRLLRGDIDSEATWKEKVAPIRSHLLQARYASLEAMKAVLRPRASICEALQAEYTLQVPSGARSAPAMACGGCPGCRPDPPYVAIPPEPVPVPSLCRKPAPGLERLFGGRHCLVVHSHRGADAVGSRGRELIVLVRSCIQQGVELVIGSEGTLDGLNLQGLLPSSTRGLVFRQSEVRRLGLLPQIPALFIDFEGGEHMLRLLLRDSRSGARHVIVTHLDTPDVPLEGSPDAVPEYSLAAFVGSI